MEGTEEERAESANLAGDETIWLLKYNRHPPAFHNALQGPEMRPCREGLESEMKSWRLESGVYIFVQPHQYESVVAALQGRDVKNGHVVVSARWEASLELALTAGVRHREILAVPPTKQRKMGTDEKAERITRTFLCYGPPLRSIDSVTESTTEAHGGLNPRRLQHLDIST